jgi:hypothetical protein
MRGLAGFTSKISTLLGITVDYVLIHISASSALVPQHSESLHPLEAGRRYPQWLLRLCAIPSCRAALSVNLFLFLFLFLSLCLFMFPLHQSPSLHRICLEQLPLSLREDENSLSTFQVCPNTFFSSVDWIAILAFHRPLLFYVQSVCDSLHLLHLIESEMSLEYYALFQV